MEAINCRQQSNKLSKQVDQNRADNFLKQRNENIQNALKIKCKNHPKRNAELLHLIPNVKNARICHMCVKENDILRKNYQEIREIFSESCQSDLLYYPILTDSEPIEILNNNDEFMDSETILMDEYFQELASQIEVIVTKRKQDRKLKLRQYSDIYQRSKACWSEITDIETLRLLLLDENKEERLAQFINNHISNAEKNTQQMKQLCDQLQDIKDKFSMEQPNKIRSLVCGLLEEIDSFKGAVPSPLHAIEQSDQYQNALQKKQIELDDYMRQFNEAQQQLKEMRILKEKNSQEIINLRKENEAFKKEISDLKQENNLQKESNASQREQLELEKKSSQQLKQQLQDTNKLLQSVKPTDLLLKSKLTLADDGKYTQLSVSKNNQNELEFKNCTQKQEDGQCYLNFILDCSTNYVLHVMLEQTKGQDKLFFFGLIPDSTKDEQVFYKNRCIPYSEWVEGYGYINTYLKGDAIRSKQRDDYSLEKKVYEVRINIEKQILRVGLLPNYEQVVQIDDPDKIKPAAPYRFFLKGLNEQTKMKITKLETVIQFNDLM